MWKQKLLESIKNKIIKNRNGENVPQLKTTERKLVHFNIVNINYQRGACIL